MYPTTGAYRTAITQNIRNVRITGSITLKDSTIINISDEDIVQGSLYVSEQAVSGEDIEIGNVYASELGVSLDVPLANPYSLDGARVELNFGLDIGSSLWENVPLGVFYITDIQRKQNVVNIKAIDSMLLFDIPCGEPGSSSPRNLVVHACDLAGVTLGTSVFEIDTFANATLLFAAPDASKIKTCRDLLMWACQIMGAFARIGKLGQLEIIPIKSKVSSRTISKQERFSSKVSDFAIQITKVTMQIGDTSYARGIEGMILSLEENPLMAGMSEGQINSVLDNILAQVTTAIYVPFDAEFIGDPSIQPGDYITLADTSALGSSDIASIITHSTWRYRGPHNLKGAGKHGLIRGVQNQQVKAVSSIVAIARAAQDLALSADQTAQLLNEAIGGNVLIRQTAGENNEILIMDHPDPEQAVKIWRWNINGLGYSDNCVGADNPARVYPDLAMTMDGVINANYIKTGQLDAGMVQIGSATTFEAGYDPTQIVAGSSVGMGVDADCLGLWHFDGSLNSHKGVLVDSNALFGGGCFGQALSIATGKHLKVPTTDILASEGAINFRAKNLSASANGSVLIDLPDNAGNQGMICGIANDGKLFIEDAKLQFQSVETSQADFQTGTLSEVSATAEGNLELARDGTDFSYEETTQADFNTGTLTNVTATSEGNLELEYTPGETTYGTDFTGGKTYSADSSLNNTTYPADNAFDNDTATLWFSGYTVYPHWVKVDLGSGVTKTARKLRINKFQADLLRTFKLQGSNDDSVWTDIYSGVASQITGWLEFTFSNSIAYRYYRIYGIDSYDATPMYMQIAEIEIMEATETQGTYTTSGTRETIVDLSGSVSSGGTNIEWLKTTPTDTTVTVETALSTDGGSTYGAYQEATSGSSIPGIASDTDLSTARLKIRETLSTTDTSATPQLHNLSLDIYASYKSSGYRYKVYDVSAVGSVGSSKITWTENKPASTTLTVKAAISTDGGDNYGSWQACTSGQAVPGLTQGMDVSNARLKVQEDLATSDGTKTPQLQSLSIEVNSNVKTAYGVNKSTLTAWDSISLAWKADRLSLVVNDEEACYIENPGLPASLGSHIFIGTDRNGNNAINTLVDELRIDKVYREVNIRTGWHKTGVPFYTSEDMKQWPGYLKAETDGIKVYDSSDALRVLLGSWLRSGGSRRYGLKIHGGELYSTVIQTGEEGSDSYTFVGPTYDTFSSSFHIKLGGKMLFEILSDNRGPVVQFFDPYYDDRVGWITPMDDPLGKGMKVEAIALSGTGKVLGLSGSAIRCSGNLSMFSGSKNNIEFTESYGAVTLTVRESPEQKYVDEGISVLESGECRVDVDPIFLECIEPNTADSKWHIHITPYADVALYVAEIGETYFVIKERQNGITSGAEFTWSLSATRKNYGHIRFQEEVV